MHRKVTSTIPNCNDVYECHSSDKKSSTTSFQSSSAPVLGFEGLVKESCNYEVYNQQHQKEQTIHLRAPANAACKKEYTSKLVHCRINFSFTPQSSSRALEKGVAIHKKQ
jgi:hypothetical protein